MDETTLRLLLFALLPVSSLLFILWMRRRYLRWQLRVRFDRARDAEARAPALLRRAGYRVIAEQVSADMGVWVDGEWLEVGVRADFLAVRRGRTYVVEVKSGKKAIDPTSTATRRQLLEYQKVFATDGVLLADMENNTLQEVRFEEVSAEAGTSRMTWFLLGMGTGLLLAWQLGGLLK